MLTHWLSDGVPRTFQQDVRRQRTKRGPNDQSWKYEDRQQAVRFLGAGAADGPPSDREFVTTRFKIRELFNLYPATY